MYKVAIVGAGVWANNHMTGWRAREDAEVVSVVRSSEERAKQTARRWGVPEWSGDYKAVIARPDIDIVDICLPHDMHAAVACEALEAGKHVVLEKPVAATLEEARRLADTAKRTGRRVMVSENWIYAWVVQKAKAAIAGGEIGDAYMVRTTMDMDVRPSFQGLGWRHDPAKMGGGALIDGHIHSISAARYLMGEIDEVAAVVKNCHFDGIAPLEDTSVLLCKFASGATGTLVCSWTAQRHRPHTEFTILGTKGTLEFDTHERHFLTTRGGKRAEETNLAASRGFVEQIAHFMECVTKGTDPITTPEEQIGSLQVVMAAYRAAKSGRFEKVGAAE